MHNTHTTCLCKSSSKTFMVMSHIAIGRNILMCHVALFPPVPCPSNVLCIGSRTIFTVHAK